MFPYLVLYSFCFKLSLFNRITWSYSPVLSDVLQQGTSLENDNEKWTINSNGPWKANHLGRVLVLLLIIQLEVNKNFDGGLMVSYLLEASLT